MTMTITRALVTLKRLDERIQRAIDTGVFVGKVVGKGQHRKVVDSSGTLEDLENKIIGSYDTIEQLFKNREKLKSAIISSNAMTYVTIGHRSLTVAEAIALKETLPYRKHYLSTLRQQRLVALKAVDTANAALQTSLDNMLNTYLDGDKSKLDPAFHDTMIAPQREKKEMSLLTPVNIDARIAELEEEIGDLESEIDFVLSESNARTTIAVYL